MEKLTHSRYCARRGFTVLSPVTYPQNPYCHLVTRALRRVALTRATHALRHVKRERKKLSRRPADSNNKNNAITVAAAVAVAVAVEVDVSAAALFVFHCVWFSGRLFVEQSFFVQIYNLLFNLFYC